MKKIILLITLIGLLCLLKSRALDITNYETLNLIETLEEENIPLEFTNYEENDIQIPIYFFRGSGCEYCQYFLRFLNSITDEYGKYFKLVSFEVWKNPNNKALYYEVSEFLGVPSKTVPYIIIGDKVIDGYLPKYDEEIKNAITNLYNKEERYDVFREIDLEKNTHKEEIKENKEKTKDTQMVIKYIIVIITFLFMGLIAIYVYKEGKKR